MCIFSGPVEQVSKTKIAVFKVFSSEKKVINNKKYKVKTGKPMQLTIYENKVSLNNPAAMILPFPLIKGVNRFKLVDLSNYERIMDDIDELFPVDKKRIFTASNSSNDDSYSIPVKMLGSYKVSVVPNFSEFSKLKFEEFNLSKSVSELLSQYYSENYGFVVCILMKSAKFHPIGYLHEFDEVFIPTRHYHNDEYVDPQAESDIDSIFNYRTIDIEDVNTPLGEIMHDDYANQQIKRTGLERNMANLGIKRHSDIHGIVNNDMNDWDHSIYIFGFEVRSLRSFVNSPGVKYYIAENTNLQNIKNRIDFSKFPKFIFIGDIFIGVKITIDRLYTGNHDLFLAQ